LSKELNIILPEEYINFIGSCAHAYTRLSGKLDNFLYEDDVDVELIICPQILGKELEQIKECLEENKFIISLGYIPIGIFNDNGYLYIDLKKENKIVWLPFENCVGLTTYEEFDSEGFIIFNNLEELMECFFMGKKFTLIKQ
jgi:hypothetical protein